MVDAVSSKPIMKAWWIAAMVAVTIALVAWLVVGAMRETEPRLNEPTHVIGKFVSTKTFDRMPYEKQRLYYKILDDRGNKEIEHAVKSGQLTQGEYRTALDCAWIGKHINRVEKYLALPAGNARLQYIDQLLVKKFKKEAEQEKKGGEQDDDIDADETAAGLRVESWPANVREQWNQFHNAYRREKKAREEAVTRPSP